MGLRLALLLSFLCGTQVWADPVHSRETRVLRLFGVSNSSGKDIVKAAYPGEFELFSLRVTPELAKTIKGIHGWRESLLVKATIQQDGNAKEAQITSVEPYSSPPELSAPHAWLFDDLTEQKAGGATTVGVKLSKYDVTMLAALPAQAKAASGISNVFTRERLQSFKRGDVVEVELNEARTPPILVDIDHYRDPIFAEFVRLQNVKDGSKVLPAIVLKVMGEEKTFQLPAVGPASPPSHAAMHITVRKLKPGYSVLYSVRADPKGGNPVLRDLRLDVAPVLDGLGPKFVAPCVMVRFITNSERTRTECWKQFGHPTTSRLIMESDFSQIFQIARPRSV